MKILLIKFSGLWLAVLFASNLLAASDAFLVCETDMSSKASPYEWGTVGKDVPMYLLPDDTVDIYRKLWNDYLTNLKPGDESRAEVKGLITVLEKLVSKQITALVRIGVNPMSEQVEIDFGDNNSIPLICADINQQYLVDLIHLSNSLEKIHNASFEVFRQQANLQIQKRNLQYQNWFDNGLAMWPQETWLNGLLLGKSDAEKPAKHQWVLLRPSIGLSINTDDGLSDGKPEETLGLELGGFVYYLREDYSSYWGLSVLASMGEDRGVGYGLLLRYDNYVIGYTQRDQDTSLGINEDRNYFYIGYDLYNLVHAEKDKFKGFKKSLREKFSAYGK